jgi:tetratricopeptide (TPR) repeat protein
MNRITLVLVLATMIVSTAAADVSTGIERADELQEAERYEEQMELLEETLEDASNSNERAEVYWRMSRATLGIGDLAADAGAPDDELIATYEEAEGYADQAIAADPNNHNGYFYKSANIGKAGQVRGVLNSLVSAAPMRDLLEQTITKDPDYAPAYFVLGQLYAQVPGVISFGNDDYAVSFARKSIDLHEAELDSGVEDEMAYDYYIQLASHLIERDWNERKRNREHDDKRQAFQSTSDPLERHFHYEGMVDIPDVNDTDEAEQILDRMISLLQGIRTRSAAQDRHLALALELQSAL